MKSLLSVFLLSLSLAGSCFADLIVVADLGGESTDKLYEAIQPETDSYVSPVTSKPLEEALFPIVSEYLQPGSVSDRELSLPGFSPLFLIGDDRLSERWLAENKKALLSLNATGLVVSVSSRGRFEALRQHAGNLTLMPLSGDDLAKRLSLNHYPVLITATGLSQ